MLDYINALCTRFVCDENAYLKKRIFEMVIK